MKITQQPTLDATTKVLIVGYGRFGKHLNTLLGDFAPDLHVHVHQPAPRHIGDGSFDVSLYDIIILAVPVREYENVIKDIVPRMKQTAILVDVATVKEYTTQLLEKYAKGRYWVATHPMWGPESYLKTRGDVRGYRLVVTGHSLPKGPYKRLRRLVGETGIKLVDKSASQHDGDLAQTLFVAHYFGQTMAFAGFKRTEIDTVSFGYLMNMVESVRNDAELFLDVYRYNRYCRDVRVRIESGMHKVGLLLEGVWP